jgi:hypothetical protein
LADTSPVKGRTLGMEEKPAGSRILIFLLRSYL